MPRVLIAGGGISGLTIAYRLQKLLPSAEIVIWESGNRLGGNVWTEQINDLVIEHGPNGFLDNKTSTIELAKDVGLGDRLITANQSARQHRYLFVDNAVRELPRGLLTLFTTSLLSVRGKLRLLAEPLIRRGNQPGESVADFAIRRFGRETAEVFVDALVTGIYGGDPALLECDAAFPRLVSMEAKHRSIVLGGLRSRAKRQNMWSFPEGLQELIEAIASQLVHKPTFGRKVRQAERSDTGWVIHDDGTECVNADAVVLACPAFAQRRIVKSLDPHLAAMIAEIPYNRIAVVAIAYRERDVPRKAVGFGFIAPQRTRRDILGVQWCSAIYSGRAPAGQVLWRVLCGGWHRGDVVDWPDDRLVSAVQGELSLALGVSATPVFAKVIRWHQAIPQYTIGHRQRVIEIEKLTAQHDGLFLTGSSYRGISLNDCVENAGRVAGQVVGYLAGRTRN